MESRRGLSLVLVVALLSSAFSVPVAPRLRLRRALDENELKETEDYESLTYPPPVRQYFPDPVPPPPSVLKDIFGPPPSSSASTAITSATSTTSTSTSSTTSLDDDDDDDSDEFEPMNTSETIGGGGGSNLFSLLRLAGPLLSGSSGNIFLQSIMKELFGNVGTSHTYGGYPGLPYTGFLRRSGIADNEIELDTHLKPPPFQRQETVEHDTEESESRSESHSAEESEENNAAEQIESNEDGNNGGNDNGDNGNVSAKQDTESNEADGDDSDYDSDEPPGGGDGQGGGILGILAGLSGGEDGSDLATLLATVSGIVLNLSGDGVDVNALIASGIGLFVGLLSEGEENPGSILASYLLTSLDTLTGGGSENNGAFFGKFLSKLITGTSAAPEQSGSASSEEGKGEMKDSSGFLLSFISGLLGNMSKGSSAGSSKPWRRSFMR